MWGSGYNSSVINRYPGTSGAEKTLTDAIESRTMAHKEHLIRTSQIRESFGIVDGNYRGKI